MKLNREKGYLLGEITLAMAVITIIVIFVLSNFIRDGDKAKKSVCLANLKQMEVAKVRLAIDKGLPTGKKVKITDIVPSYINTVPSCPSKGNYKIRRIGMYPLCTVHGE